MKNKKERVHRNVVDLYNTLLDICFNGYNKTADEEKEVIDKIIDPSSLFFKNYKYNKW